MKTVEQSRAATSRWQAKQRLASGKQLVQCQICGKLLLAIDWKHLKFHGITTAEYYRQFPGAPTQSPQVIEMRKLTKYANLYQPVDLSPRVRSLLVGAVLGDATLEATGGRHGGTLGASGHARYRETAANEDYVLWKASILSEAFSVHFNGGSYVSTQTGREYNRYSVRTGAHPTLGEWYHRWYPAGKKVVSRVDVETFLDPLALAIWFYDDGCIARGAKDYRAHLYTLAFPLEDVSWLATLLAVRFGIQCAPTHLSSGWAITMPRLGRDRLIEVISPFPAPGMAYKLDPPQIKEPWWIRFRREGHR